MWKWWEITQSLIIASNKTQNLACNRSLSFRSCGKTELIIFSASKQLYQMSFIYIFTLLLPSNISTRVQTSLSFDLTRFSATQVYLVILHGMYTWVCLRRLFIKEKRDIATQFYFVIKRILIILRQCPFWLSKLWFGWYTLLLCASRSPKKCIFCARTRTAE